ncbi:MAG: nucleoside 2-deoxyribosyltransferase [Chloroflexi bacterium]|nr:nucleoside 2-deoxyribosyltransferase [Chloroflexota bacterium]
MNIYFAASIRAGRELQPSYEAIVQHLKDTGHTVLSEQVASKTIIVEERDVTDQQIYTQDTGMLDRCDVVVAEVTVPSLGVGYEIAYALHKTHKPVLCLCQGGTHLSAMLTGNTTLGLRIVFYTSVSAALLEVDRFLSDVIS